MELIEALMTRQSTSKLGLPAPSTEQVKVAIKCGMRAPDHGLLRPWRFLVVQGKGLEALGDLFVAAERKCRGEIDTASAEKLKAKTSRAPLIIVAVAEVTVGHKVPEIEQVIAVGAAVQNIQLALHDMGFQSMWRTGAMAFDSVVKEGLGFDPKDSVVGFLYVGTALLRPRPIEPLDTSVYCREWPMNTNE